MAKRNFTQPSTTKSQQSHFSQVPSAKIQRSRMDRSHGLKTSFGQIEGSAFWDSGNALIPVFVDEVLPGDSFHLKSTGFARLATPLHPVMDNMFLDIHYFFVPNRLVWENWQRFMGERDNPDDDPNDYTVPQIPVQFMNDGEAQTNPDRLAYYMGLPMSGRESAPTETHNVNAMPFRAYRLIWNEWYRDQNLQDSVDVPKDDGPDPLQWANNLLPRGKRKDYFTGALPWPQKGDPVVIPVELEGFLNVYGDPSGEDFAVQVNGTGTDFRRPFLKADSGVGEEPFQMVAAGQSTPSTLSESEWGNVRNSATINDLRTAFQIQKLLERDARGGTRYTELIQSHFGVTSPDSRLQRPEFLGGSSSRITINPIANTVGEEGQRPQGDLGGYGTTVQQCSWSKSFTEHGFVIGLVSYRADLTYQRGVERMWSRTSRYDYYWPALAHLGEQAILNKEIHFAGDAGGANTDNDVFAYQERYGEYRFKPSRVTGLFNSDSVNSLDVWHLAQDFDIDSPLPFNEDFIRELPPIDRVIAVPTEPFFIADFWFDLKCDRPMPVYSVPGLVDHF